MIKVRDFDTSFSTNFIATIHQYHWGYGHINFWLNDIIFFHLIITDSIIFWLIYKPRNFVAARKNIFLILAIKHLAHFTCITNYKFLFAIQLLLSFCLLILQPCQMFQITYHYFGYCSRKSVVPRVHFLFFIFHEVPYVFLIHEELKLGTLLLDPKR